MAIVPAVGASRPLAVARQRCWRFDWVLDLDIKGFFDNIDWDLLMRAVRDTRTAHGCCSILNGGSRRPCSMPDGTLVSARERDAARGCRQSHSWPISFLHYAFDRWMQREHPDIPFERYADDVICHCRSEAQALSLRQALEARLAECKLELHPQKTKIVYCKDSNRPTVIRSNASISWALRFDPDNR